MACLCTVGAQLVYFRTDQRHVIAGALVEFRDRRRLDLISLVFQPLTNEPADLRLALPCHLRAASRSADCLVQLASLVHLALRENQVAAGRDPGADLRPARRALCKQSASPDENQPVIRKQRRRLQQIRRLIRRRHIAGKLGEVERVVPDNGLLQPAGVFRHQPGLLAENQIDRPVLFLPDIPLNKILSVRHVPPLLPHRQRL